MSRKLGVTLRSEGCEVRVALNQKFQPQVGQNCTEIRYPVYTSSGLAHMILIWDSAIGKQASLVWASVLTSIAHVLDQVALLSKCVNIKLNLYHSSHSWEHYSASECATYKLPAEPSSLSSFWPPLVLESVIDHLPAMKLHCSVVKTVLPRRPFKHSQDQWKPFWVIPCQINKNTWPSQIGMAFT